MSLCFRLVHQYFIPEDFAGPPTFTVTLYLHTRLYDPEEAMTRSPVLLAMMLLYDSSTSSALLDGSITGLNHFNHFGFRSADSLSTLNEASYLALAQDSILNVLGLHF
jgi:hypothetical protein